MNISSFDIKEKFKTVKNVVMQVTPIEAKVRACTSNDPWGAKSTDKAEVAEATYNFEDYKVVMQTLWKRMTDTGKDWRHVYKGLQLLEYLLVHGSERVQEEARDSLYTIRSLRSFRYIDEKGKDYGEGIRELAKKMVKFIQDDKAIAEEREKSKNLSGKYEGMSRSDSRYRGGQSSARSKPTRYDDDDRSSRRRDDYDDDDRPSRSKVSSKYDDDEDDRPSRSKPSSSRYDDEEDSPPPRRATQPTSAFDDDDDSFQSQPRSARGASSEASGRPRAPSNGFEQPNTNVRKPRPPSPVEERRQQQQPVKQQTVDSFFDAGSFQQTSQPDSFFDSQPAPQQHQQQNFGFNPRGGNTQQPVGGRPPQQQQQFASNNNNDFNADFDDDSFPADDFDNFKSANQEEPKDDLFSMTSGLVDFSLDDSKMPNKKPQTNTQGGVLMPSNSSSASNTNNQNLTLKDKARLQGKKIPVTSGAPTGRGAPMGQPMGGFGGQPMGVAPGGFGGQPMGGYGAQPMGGGFGGQPMGGQPMGGYGAQPMGGFGGQPMGGQPMGRGAPMGGGFGGQPMGGQPMGGYGAQPMGVAPMGGGFGGAPMGRGMTPSPMGRGNPPFGNPGRGAPQHQHTSSQNNDNPFF